MALREHRRIISETIEFFCNDTTATRGGFMVLNTAGSGVALDDGAAVATYAANPSGKAVLGCLLQDVVNYDLTVRTPNYHKQEVQTGGKVTLADRGTLSTNFIYPGVTPTAGQTAYLTMSGYLTTTISATGGEVATPKVGRFDSTKDEDGFAKVSFNLPN